MMVETNFDWGHISKERLNRLGVLPLRLDVHEETAEWDVVAENVDDKNSEEENDRNHRNCTF
jgi:hypothetical protein